MDMEIKCVDCKKKRTCLRCKFFIHFLVIFNQTEFEHKIILLAKKLFLSYPREFKELHHVRTANENHQRFKFDE